MSDHAGKTLSAIILERQPGLHEEAAKSSLLDLLKSTAKKVAVDAEDFYIVEGDLVLDGDQLEIFAVNEARRRTEQALSITPGSLLTGVANIGPDPMSGALMGILALGGKLVRWKEGVTLTYCVLRETFTSQQRYELVRANMQKATEDWQRICGIQFDHRVELDESAGTKNPGVVFTVREFDAGGQFIASAFFPTDPSSRRRVLIDGSYFADDLSFDKVGVLRHELGHTMGFRHEHIRADAPAACPDEPLFAAGGAATPLTAYDPKSVMHYFCGGVGSRELALTELDKFGAQTLYGPPLNQFFFVEV
ncbi:MAG: matrixin family metalloprotease [Pseudonocardiaceae bacterium]